jgi:hypothetical protein
MSLTFVSFDDCFDGEVTPGLEMVYRLIKEYNLPFASVSDDDGAGGFIADTFSFKQAYTSGALVDLLVLLDKAHITEISFEDAYDWPWNEFTAIHRHVVLHSFTYEEFTEILHNVESNDEAISDEQANAASDYMLDSEYRVAIDWSKSEDQVELYYNEDAARDYNHYVNHCPKKLSQRANGSWILKLHTISPVSTYYEMPSRSSWSELAKFLMKDSWDNGSKFEGRLQDQLSFIFQLQWLVTMNAPYPNKQGKAYMELVAKMTNKLQAGKITEVEYCEVIHEFIVKEYSKHWNTRKWLEGLTYLWRK